MQRTTDNGTHGQFDGSELGMIMATGEHRVERRHLLRLAAGAGLGIGGFAAIGSLTSAAPTAERPGARARQQDATPPATPIVGQRADGTNLWRVQVGAMDMAKLTELHTYFPGELTINEGDTVWFDMTMPGFHTVTFLSGADVPPLLMPDPEAGTPAAGAMPTLVYNPQLFPAGGDTYDGTGFVNSGPDFMRDPSQPYMLTFTKAGSYDYLCVPHAAVMRGKIVVQPAGSDLPMDQAGYEAQIASKIAELYAAAETGAATESKLTSTTQADGSTLWEATVGGGGETPVRIQAFLPAEITVKARDSVKWVHRSPGEPHTVSFLGAGATQPEDTTIGQFANGAPKIIQSMETFLPQGGNVFSGTGFVSSGFMGVPSVGLPSEFTCRFDTPGEYVVYCLLHGDAQGNGMAGKVIVTA